jgi:hypothetical protein
MDFLAEGDRALADSHNRNDATAQYVLHYLKAEFALAIGQCDVATKEADAADAASKALQSGTGLEEASKGRTWILRGEILEA